MKCIEDEIPFELPNGWTWERLGNVTTIARGGSPRPIKSYLTTELDGVNWIKIGDTEKNGKYIFSTKEKIKPEGIAKSRYVKNGDFLLTNSMSFGRPYILKTDGCIHDGWLMIGNTEIVFNQDYLYYALSSDFMYNMLSVLAGGSTVDNLNSELVKSLLFPIPPMQEQIIIANKAESLMKIVDTINNNEKELLKNLKSIKSKILDLAIRGKLVPQNPNDEPASVLLERIRAEKEELIKQGKIKRDKKESVIFKGDDNSYYEKIGKNIVDISEEIPFEIPENWSFARLEDVLVYEQPTPYIVSSTDYKDDYQTPVLTAGKSFIIGYTNETFGIKTELPVIIFDDFTTDSKYVDFPFKVKSSAMKILTAKEKLINTKFAYYAMQVVECDNYNHKRYWISEFSKKLIPLPPKKEQVEIVNAIEELYKYIEHSLS